MSIQKDDQGIFTADEENVLSKTLKLRLDMVNNLTETALPVRTGDVRTVNELLTSIDNQVYEKVKIRAKQKESEDKNKTITYVAAILGSIAQDQPRIIGNRDIELPDNYLPIDVVPGEMEIGSEQLALKDFIRDEGNENEFSS